MKKRYYLSMLSLFPLILAFDSVYFVLHQSLKLFLMSALAHFVLFGLINFIGTYFLYKPIDHLFIQSEDTKQAKKRIHHLTWYSTGWIFFLGILYVAFTPLLAFVFLKDFETFSMDKIPPILWLTLIPSSLFLFAIFPSFITYFLINDFNLHLKTKVFLHFQILYPAGKKRIGLTLLFVFIILGFFPTLLVILELVLTSAGDEYAQFTSLDPLETVLADRFLVLIGMILAVVLITRSFTKPIYSLLKEINKVREGNYSTRAAIITDDEIGVLTKEFNEMVHELEISHNKLEESNRTLEIKVEDRTQELKQKNSELEDTLDKLKQMQKQVIVQEKMATLGQLVAGLTHEINTPIGAIRSMNDTKSKAVMKLQTALENIAPDTAGKDHEIKKVLGVILKADRLIDQGTERLNEIIKNLKNFARLDKAETVMADIHEGLDSVLALIRHDLLTNIEVVREYSEIPPFVCYARKLNQVFFNILKNACQAIEDKGRITITTSLKKNMVRVAIRDTGKGIKQDELESIFDPGFTTKSSVVRASLGLSICYQIIQEHHGKINVESQPGKGSVFTVILPTEF
ncbi:HAMP domain-containing protein [bacterium]|nr:HAMP domain-containing protein [bacterium]